MYTYANAHQEAHHIRLLLLLKFLDIFEGTHRGCSTEIESALGATSKERIDSSETNSLDGTNRSSLLWRVSSDEKGVEASGDGCVWC